MCSVNQICPRPRSRQTGLLRLLANAAHAGGGFQESAAHMNQEKWKAIKGYEGLYEVSDLGNIRSIGRYTPARSGSCKFQKGMVRKLSFIPKRYVCATLSKEGVPRTFDIHRLVAKAFIPNPDNLPEVDHKDNNKHNNRVDNLQWISRLGNAQKAVASGLQPRGDRCSNAVATEEIVLKIRKLYATTVPSQLKLEKMFGISRGAIWYIVNRKTWRHI